MEKANKLRALSLLLSVVLLLLNNIVAGSAAAAVMATATETTQSGTCNGTDGECAAAEMVTAVEEVVEMELPFDVEIHRRILAGHSSITKLALHPGGPACPHSCAARGQPYTQPSRDSIIRHGK